MHADGKATETRYDVIVIGAGCAGMSAALFAAMEGLSVLLIEHSPYVGGTTARSAGAIWVPNTEVGAVANPDDRPENAALYLRHAIGNAARLELVERFLTLGPEAIRRLNGESEVRLRAFPRHPDYLSDLPGSTVAGRVLEAEPFDGRLLGDAFDLVRPPLPEFTLFGGMMVDRRDIGHLLAMKRSLGSFVYSTKLVARYLADRLRYKRGTRLVMGNALVGRLLLSLLKRGVAIATRTQVVSLDRVDGRIGGVTVERHGRRERIAAGRAVILASGGFNLNPRLRRDLIPPSVVYSPMSPDNTGDMAELAFAVGARFGEGGRNNAYWTPVSVGRRADGSTAVFPHFVLDRAKPGTIVVNRAGRRFLDESVDYHLFGRAMIEVDEKDPCIPAFLIADRRAFLAYGLGMARPGGLGRRRLLASGYLIEAASLDDLARRTEVDAEALKATVARFNGFAATGIDEDFGRGRTAYARNLGDPAVGPNPTLGRLEEAPFYAVRLYPGDIGASTGLVTDADARVLGAAGPIEGLYAVGNDMNSVMGGSYPGPGITLGPAVVFAYAAIVSIRKASTD